jgi:4-hydroxy-tetrahydrodipicolinate reductase
VTATSTGVGASAAIPVVGTGTALALGETAATARGTALQTCASYARQGHPGARGKGEIGFSVIRGGDIVGEHTIMLAGTGERLELTHRATDRGIFARGALEATVWIASQSPGMYGMSDMLEGRLKPDS